MPETVILLHGAWQGAWVWDGVAPALSAVGWAPVAPDLPGNGADGRAPGEVSFEDHIAHVQNIILAADGPVRIVAHSGAGVLATALAEDHPDRIAKVVYICGMMLPSGVTFPEFTAPFVAADPAANGIVPYLEAAPGGSRVPLDAAMRIFYHDAPADAARAAAARLTVQGHDVRAPRVTWSEARAGSVLRGYIRCGADRSVLPEVQDAMCAARPGARMAQLPTGHAPMLADLHALMGAISDLLGQPGQLQAVPEI
jgi:pimeloyl-ACP methyl ester carboxylesterase